MKSDITAYPEFLAAIQEDELVYLFGAGISSALTGNHACSWWQWICNGIDYLKDPLAAKELKESMKKDSSADNLIQIVGDVLTQTKAEGTYHTWMRASFEGASITNTALVETLRKLLLPQDVFATTNYDLLLEKATGLKTISYEEPQEAFAMLDHRKSDAILHLHGVYDSAKGKDNIVADQAQYDSVLDDKGAQFVQHILGTRTLVLVGCGQTSEDGNISQFLRFAKEHLKMEKRYYFLYKAGQKLADMPDNMIPIPYGNEYADLPLFLEDMAQARMKTKLLANPIVGLSPYQQHPTGGDGLQQYHFSMQTVPFCGRTEELAALKEFVYQDRSFSWWAVTGQAGAGKSRLALELLRQLPAPWVGFFLNDNCSEKDVESINPFSNTIVVIDYVAGRERTVANILHAIEKPFAGTAYHLRVLLLERENIRNSGSWYGKLLQRYGRYDVGELKAQEYTAAFLNIGDLDEKAISDFIGKVCKLRGYDVPEKLQNELLQEYAKKKELLQFRPLFVQIFVEAWLDNNFIMPKYDRFEDLLRMVMEREQQRWLEIVEGDQECCNALIRLLLRANIGGKLSGNDIPAYYQADWKCVEKLWKKYAFPGKQQEEQRSALLASVCHSLRPGEYEMEPMYPDLVKEYMFYFYSDAEALPDVLRELWQNAAKDFSIFITRCRMDFPYNSFYEQVLRIYDANTRDIGILTGRMNLLRKFEINKGDDPAVLLDIIDNEYTFWKSICPESDNPETTEQVACMKFMGLSLVAKQYSGWSYYDLSQVMEVVREMFHIPGGQGVQILKQVEGQKISSDLAASGFFAESEEVMQLADSIDSGTPNLSAYVHIMNQNTRMMNALLGDNIPQALAILRKMENDCTEIEACKAFMRSCRNILMLCQTALTEEQVAQVMECAQRINTQHPKDKSIYASMFTCGILVLQYRFGRKEETADTIRKQLQNTVLSCALSDFAAANTYAEDMGTAWAAREMFQLNFIEKEEQALTSLIDQAHQILQVNPHLVEVVCTRIQASRAFYKNICRKNIPKAEVETVFAYVEKNPESETVREAFFAMLEESEEHTNVRSYLTKPLVSNAIRDARYNPLSDGGIPQVRQGEDFLHELLMALEPGVPYRRATPKVGANAPCPCGSGKKFKKCCRGKGVYD